MRYMNQYDIDDAVFRYQRHPIKGRAARILQRFQRLTDNCGCDGWAHWRAPCAAARKLIELIEDNQDPTELDLKKAISPIRSCLTKHRNTFKDTISFE